MIINIRGTSGSGKTFTARSFMETYAPNIAITDNKGKIIAHCVYYYNMQPVYFIGAYTNVCGGCDSISTQDMACSLVRHFSMIGHVVFEGLLMSHLFARYYALYNELVEGGDKFIIAYMDTPLDLCIERVKSRRIAKGNMKPLNPQNTISHYYATWDTKNKFDAVGCDTRFMCHKKDPVKQLIEMLSEDNSMLFALSYKEESFR